MNSLKRILCVLLCAALLLGLAGGASAAGKKSSGIIIGQLGDMTDDWYYVSSTVPEGYLNQDKQEVRIMTNDGQEIPDEYADTCEVTFKSGDDALMNAMVVEKEDDHWVVYIDNNALTAPGKAVFHFRAESPSFLYDRDFTINVLDWNEYPLLTVVNEHPVVEAAPGESIPDDTLVAAFGQLNRDEIFNNVLKLKARNVMSKDYFIPRSNTDVEFEGSGLYRQYYPSVFGSYYETVVNDFGVYDVKYVYHKGNIRASIPVTISAKGYRITADKTLGPGETVTFTVKGTTEGRTFTWSAEGEGAVIDASTGVLQLDAKAPAGTLYTVTAEADNGDTVSFREYYPGPDCIMNGIEFRNTSAEGFQIPTPSGESWGFYGSRYSNDVFNASGLNGKQQQLSIDASYYLPTAPNEYAEDPEVARAEFEKDLPEYSKGLEDVETEIFDLDGHPAALMMFNQTQPDNQYHVGCLFYLRNNRMLRVRAYNWGGEVPPVTREDMKFLAYKIGYDENQAPLSRAKAKLAISAKDGAVSVTAGKALQLTAAFELTELINKKEKNDGVEWSVVNAETGAEEPAAAIAKNGQLKVDKSLAAPVELEVKAVSTVFGTEATYRVTAVPVVTKLTLEPEELFFYTGRDEAQTVKAVLEPDTVPPLGITWTPAKKDLLEITPVEDGTVSVRALAAGKTNIAVKEPGGKSATLKVSVVDPVQSLELTVKGAGKAGGTVPVNATIWPNGAGNKALEWSLDVGEDVATVNNKGQVKIAKTAPAGTKITVTCRALGAPEPIVATAVIEIP